jgi:hypothetical protein
VIPESGSGVLRVVQTDLDRDGVSEPIDEWTETSIAANLNGASGIAYDPSTDTFVVSFQTQHCVRRLTVDGTLGPTVAGRCGVRGSFPGFLDGPAAVAVAASGAVYVSDVNNGRVVRAQAGRESVVIGDGSASSAGEGRPARNFPVDQPGGLAVDAFGNLFVASRTTVKLIANVDGDGDADGDDQVITVYGGGDRTAFPENASFCIDAIAVDDEGTLYVTDACQRFLVRVTPTTAP